MAKINVLNMQGEVVSTHTLKKSVWGQEWNDQIMYDVVKAQQAAMRQGSSQTKNRAEGSGGGRKPYRQKGTGHARQGTIRAPQFRGGGHVFELHPRDYSFSLNKKVKRQALRIALSQHALNGSLIVLEGITFEEIKTKNAEALLNAIKAQGKTLVLVDDFNDNFELSIRNIPTAALCVDSHVSVYDILCSDTLVVTLDSVKNLEEALNE